MSRPDPSRTARHRPTAAAWLHVVLALALVLAQALGLLHRTAHAPQGVDRAPPAGHADDLHAGHEHAGTGLFGHAPGQSDACRLFDQLALSDLLVDATPAMPVFEVPPLAIEPTGTARARAVTTAFRARAPPAHG